MFETVELAAIFGTVIVLATIVPLLSQVRYRPL
jgi:hypothetical protein